MAARETKALLVIRELVALQVKRVNLELMGLEGLLVVTECLDLQENAVFKVHEVQRVLVE